MELVQFAEKLVTWRKSVVGLLNAREKVHIEGRVASAKLDDAGLVVGDDGIAIATLERCCVNSHACNTFGFAVTFLLRRRSVLREEVRYLMFGQGSKVGLHHVCRG